MNGGEGVGYLRGGLRHGVLETYLRRERKEEGRLW